MKLSRFIAMGILIGVTMSSNSALAATDANAAVVQLRKSCLEAGKTLTNCFTDLNTLNSWIWNTRNPKPSATSPLIVNIGPGTFTGLFSCTSYGYVTLRGSGMRQTALENGSGPVSTANCVNMVFSDMTLRNTLNLFGVRTVGGSTFWENVEIDGYGYAWFDSPTSCPGTGTHYWFNSRIMARSAGTSTTAYYNACDVSWFFGSEITSNGSAGSQIFPITATGGEVHVYGGVIRAIAGSGITANLVAAQADGAAKIHIHGTGIDVISSTANNITALSASNGGVIHANQAAYNLSTGTGGTITRIVKDTDPATHVHAPYLWEEHSNPPNITSVNGADMAVVTSATSDGQPHLVIYSSTCASKWYDTVDRACRP